MALAATHLLLGLPGAFSASVPADDGGGGDVPAWVQALAAPSDDLPTDALLFQTAQYWSNTQEQLITALLGNGGIGAVGNFVPGAISAAGMDLTIASGNLPIAAGDLATSFCQITGTYVFEFIISEASDPTGAKFGRIIYCLGDGSTTDNFFSDWYGTGTDQIAFECCNQDFGSYDTVAAGTGNATWRMAFTAKANGDVVSSFNGDPIHTDAASQGSAGISNYVAIGCGGAVSIGGPLGGLLLSVVRYDVQPDADLPTLSA